MFKSVLKIIVLVVQDANTITFLMRESCLFIVTVLDLKGELINRYDSMKQI